VNTVAISYLTKEGYKKLEEKLNTLIKVRRKEIAEKLSHARSLGDLRENAEYDAAKEEQAMNERKIGELSGKLSSIQIIDTMDIPADQAYIGATVKLSDLNTDEKLEYTLVSDAEADFMEKKISVNSPIGRGLLGHRVEDVVDIEVPAGVIRYKIIEISR